MVALKGIILYLLFYLTITWSWRFYEIKKFGEVRPSDMHTIIAITISAILSIVIIYFVDIKPFRG